MTVGRFELAQGGGVPSHSHANEQISIVPERVLLFKIDGRETLVQAGRGDADSGQRRARSRGDLEDTLLVVDVFSPVRQDWIDKTDTYFKR